MDVFNTAEKNVGKKKWIGMPPRLFQSSGQSTLHEIYTSGALQEA
jgi:hypothetical protein